jgi:hypothetical protein
MSQEKALTMPLRLLMLAVLIAAYATNPFLGVGLLSIVVAYMARKPLIGIFGKP